MAKIKLNKNKLLLITGFSIIVITFLITRLPFFLYYPVPIISNDTPNYYRIVPIINQGEWPEFTNITPGYPLFIYLILLFSNKILTIIFIQNMLILFSCLLLIYAIYRLSPLLSCFSAVALAVYISNEFQTFIDCGFRVDSLYVSFIILSFAFLILAIQLKRGVFFLLCSLVMGYTIYLRPAGIFFIVIYVITIIYLLINHYSKRNLILYIIPFLIMVLGLCFYNYLTINSFVLSPFGERRLITFTLIYLEPDPAYSPEINNIIKKFQAEIPAEDKNIMFNSWNLKKIQKVLFRNWYRGDATVSQAIQQHKKWEFMDQIPVFRKLAMDAISKHPGLYLKSVLSNLYFYFFENIKLRRSFYRKLNASYKKLFITKKYSPRMKRLSEDSRRDVLKEFYNPEQLTYFQAEKNGNKYNIKYVKTNLQKVHHSVSTFIAKLFRNIFWSIAYFFTLCLSLIVLIRSKFRHPGAFIISVMTLSVLGAALIICLVGRPLLRYTYTLEFVYYLSFALLPLLVKSKTQKE